MDFHKMIVRNSRISVYKNVRFLTSKSNITQAQAQPAEAIEKACSQDRPKQPMADRSHLHSAKRIMIKFGSAVIIEGQGQGIAMSRLANLVEQMAHIFLQNKEVMFITSGCVAHGRSKLASKTSQFYKTDGKPLDKKPSAAVGQPALMNLYETLFSRYHIQTAQVLVSENDIYNDDNRRVLTETLNQLMDMRVIPILNTNDAVVPQPNVPCPTLCKGIKLADNDSLAAMLAADTQTDLLLMLTVVDGVYDKGPNDPNTKVLHSITETNTQHIDFIGQSQIGLGGMQTKVNSGLWALAHGTSVVICNGKTPDIMQTVLSGKKVGTFFSLAACEDDSTEKIAAAARTGGRALALLPGEKRAECIKKIADLLESKSKEIIAANELDIREAKKIGYSTVLIDRLKLNEPKLKSLSVGLRQISEYSAKILGKIIRKTQLAENLELTQVTVPIGVLLVIFESRPDALPQIASLAIGSGNGLVLKGGDEAVHSNRKLMDIIDEALASVNSSGAVGLVNTKEEIADLINMDQYIDLIIPRGSYKLVRFIQDNAKRIPVMGHSEGICHIFVDKDMCLEKALKILKDAKTDYPSGCNAVETILIHKDLMEGDFFSELCSMLKESGVTLHSGPNLMKYLQFGPPLAKTMKHEYSGMECCLEVVDNVQQAVDHIHKYGSGHTESIITENKQVAEKFLAMLDSACVFHNASTRMADGFRFGLGAEVGISTSRIHARGPVGIEGLLTTKWMLRGVDHTASEFSEGKRKFIHKSLPIPKENDDSDKCKS